jgi:hypothetical protein
MVHLESHGPPDTKWLEERRIIARKWRETLPFRVALHQVSASSLCMHRPSAEKSTDHSRFVKCMQVYESGRDRSFYGPIVIRDEFSWAGVLKIQCMQGVCAPLTLLEKKHESIDCCVVVMQMRGALHRPVTIRFNPAWKCSRRCPCLRWQNFHRPGIARNLGCPHLLTSLTSAGIENCPGAAARA